VHCLPTIQPPNTEQPLCRCFVTPHQLDRPSTFVVWTSPFLRWLVVSARPNRVRHPADWSFTSRCSPPRITATQLRSVSGPWRRPDGDFHPTDSARLQAHVGAADMPPLNDPMGFIRQGRDISRPYNVLFDSPAQIRRGGVYPRPSERNASSVNESMRIVAPMRYQGRAAPGR